MKEDFSRRDFFGTAAIAGAGLVMASCSQKKSFPKMTFVDKAPDGPPLKAGLIGCGGRGTGAAENFLKAGPNLQVVALADLFQDKIDKCKTRLESKFQQKIAPERMYVGFDGYKKLIDSDVDLILIATPPFFRPIHFDYAVEAKKNIFMEKPVGVDPVSIRALLASAEKSKAYNLSVVTGTQRRHQRQYLENYTHIKNGAIGKIVSARCYWNQGQLWFKQRDKAWSDMEAMLRDWVNWSWLSGDHIVEQHVHNIDVINWFVGAYPAKAVSMGGRMRRVTGDQFDFFSTDFTYENGMHLLSQCRQIDGCANEISEYLVGTEGSTNCRGTIWDKDGKIVWQYQEPAKEQETPGQVTMLDPEKSDVSPYDQEHVDLVTAIRTNKPINEAENTAKSTLTAIMARISAYTGKETTWEQMMSMDLKLGPAEFAMGPVPNITATVPVPGTSKAVPASE
jgi:myo-inositol 2-dehydrogenase / D-chiro-inositol 1-dehydrogenase